MHKPVQTYGTCVEILYIQNTTVVVKLNKPFKAIWFDISAIIHYLKLTTDTNSWTFYTQCLLYFVNNQVENNIKLQIMIHWYLQAIIVLIRINKHSYKEGKIMRQSCLSCDGNCIHFVNESIFHFILPVWYLPLPVGY